MIPIYGIISVLSQFLPFLSGVFVREKKKELLLFFYFVCFAKVANIFFLVSANLGFQNLWFTHIYYPIEFGALTFILFQWELNKNRVYAGVLAFAVFCVLVDQLFIEGFNTFGIIGLTVEGFFLTLLSARIVIILFTRNIYTYFEDYRFWIASGILIFYGVNLFGYIFINIFHLQLPLFIHSITNTIANLLYTWSFICYYKRKRLLRMT